MKLIKAFGGLQQSARAPFTLNLSGYKQADWYRLLAVAICLSALVVGLTMYHTRSSEGFYQGLVLSEIFGTKSTVESQQEKEDIKALNEVMSLEEKKEIEAMTNTYRFEYTSTGFVLKNLRFLSKLSLDNAEARLLSSLPKSLQKRAKIYIKPILRLSEVHQVDPIWVMSVMWTESHFKAHAKSHVGARGLMQVMPETRKYMYRKYRRAGHFLMVEKNNFKMEDYFEDVPKKLNKTYVLKLVNMEIGILYLKQLLKSFNYNHRLATVSYNMGPGWTHRRLRKKLPVGNRNVYLDKVTRAYKYIASRISQYEIVAKASH